MLARFILLKDEHPKLLIQIYLLFIYKQGSLMLETSTQCRFSSGMLGVRIPAATDLDLNRKTGSDIFATLHGRQW